jgi:hypothetical protein
MEEFKVSTQRRVAKRRTATALQPQRLFQMILVAPLHWPGKTVRLERNSALDYCQRLTSAHVSVAELYHENSKLFPQMLSELTVTLVQVDELRQEFIRRRAAIVRARGASELDVGPRWRELLTEVGRSTNREILYAIELRIVAIDLLAVYEPVSDILQIVKQLSAADLDKLRLALRLMADSDTPLFGGPLLFILGSFARNDMLFGPRGYRRTLLEAGHLAQEVVRQAERLGLVARPLYEFIDHDVDAVMEADGIEQSTIMVFELGEATDVG